MDTSVNIIFTDGSSRGNPGPGGWAAIVVSSGAKADKLVVQVRELGGHEDHTTNNRMELQAALGALAAITEGSKATVNTDSSYLINGITKWVKGWKHNDWKTKTKDDVLNRDLWMALDDLASARKVDWHYVGGHVGVRGNERCDEIATAYADGGQPTLYHGPLSGYAIQNILDVSHDEALAADKSSSSSRSRTPAYSYLSMIAGKIERHHSWADCEKRVKGIRGARFKKALNAEEEEKIIREFRAL